MHLTKLLKMPDIYDRSRFAPIKHIIHIFTYGKYDKPCLVQEVYSPIPIAHWVSKGGMTRLCWMISEKLQLPGPTFELHYAGHENGIAKYIMYLFPDGYTQCLSLSLADVRNSQDMVFRCNICLEDQRFCSPRIKFHVGENACQLCHTRLLCNDCCVQGHVTGEALQMCLLCLIVLGKDTAKLAETSKLRMRRLLTLGRDVLG